MKFNIKKIISSYLKTLAGILFFLFLLFVMVKVTIMIPYVQNKLKIKVVNILKENLNTDISIEDIDIRFPKKLNVNNFLIEEEKGDSVVFIENLSVSVKILPLIKHKLIVNEIYLKNSRGDFGKLIARIPEGLPEKEIDKSPEPFKWEIKVHALKFENCYFSYRDNSEEGFELILDFGKVNAEIGNINLDTLIKFKYLEAKDSFVSYQELSSPESEEDSLFNFADIRVDKTDLVNSGFSYIDSLGSLIVNISADEVNTNDLLVDITHDAVTIDKGNADNLFVEILLLPEEDTLPETNDYLNWGEFLTDWNFEGNKLKVKNTRVKIENVGAPNSFGHFNSDLLDLNYLTGTINNFKVANNLLDLEFQKLSGKEMNGLEVEQFDAVIRTTPGEFRIDKFNLKTTSAQYDMQLQTTLSPTNYLDIEGKTFNLNLDIKGKTWNDIDYFSPFLEGNYLLDTDFRRNQFHLQTKISGKTEDLKIELFDFNYSNSTEIRLYGEIINLTNPDAEQFTIQLEELKTTRADINKTINTTVTDTIFSMPEYFGLKGKLSGKNNKLQFIGKVSSNLGTVDIKNIVADLGNHKNMEVDISADLRNLNDAVNADLDKAKFHLNGSFSGSDLYNAVASLKLDIDTMTYLNHSYNNFSVSAKTDSGNYELYLSSLDSSLQLEAISSGDFHEKKKNGELSLHVYNIDLKQLNLLKNDVKLEGTTELSFVYDSITNFRAELKLENLNFHFSDTIYRMHPIDFNFLTSEQYTKLKLESFFYNLDFESQGNWQKMVDGISVLPLFYLEKKTNDTLKNIMPEFLLSGMLNYPEAFARLFFPNLPSFGSLNINGNYSKSTDQLYFGFELPGLKKVGIGSDSLAFSMNGNSSELNFSGKTYLNLNDVLKGKFDISGKFFNSELNSVVQFFDSFSGKYLALNTLFRADSNQYFLHFIPDSLIFSYDRWKIKPENLITIDSGKIHFSNFEAISENQKILLQSGEMKDKNFLRLQLQNFGMGSIENLFALDTLVYGTTNAEFTFTDIFSTPVIGGSLSIENMNLYDFDFGKLNISEFHFDKNKLNYTLSMIGAKEHIESVGKWDFTSGKENLEATLEIKKLELAELDYLLKGVISNPKGNLQANLKITGNTENPAINGFLNFAGAGMGIDKLNEYFTIGNEPVTFENNSVKFSNLQLKNRNGKTARLNGTVSLDKKSMGEQDFVITTDNMELLNTSEMDNNLYYGFLKAQTNIQLSGKRNTLKVEAKTKVDKSTNMTYIFPDVLTMNDNTGIVSFGEYSPDSAEISGYHEQQEALKSLAIEYIKANIEVESGTHFKIYFDETKSDYLDAILSGDINYNMSGDNSEITGVMSLAEGKLRYSLPMISVKDYTIEPGSSITISNDVYNPYINIVASAKVRASTEKLIENYVKVMTFTVLLKMSGELNNMKLEFDISSETDDVLVSSKLSSLSPTERNINALNLLVRGSFTVSLKSDEVGSTSMYESGLDKFYSAQLNHLISENIHFVDVNFDVQSFSDFGKYGESVVRRNYYYNLGKSLFNNRARINYKGSFDFSSSNEKQTLNSQFLQNELNLEIALTDDDTWKALFFNRNKYEGILEGKIMETGGGLKLHKEFYSIGDLLNGTKKRKEKKKVKKQETVSLKNINPEKQK